MVSGSLGGGWFGGQDPKAASSEERGHIANWKERVCVFGDGEVEIAVHVLLFGLVYWGEGGIARKSC